MQRINDYVNSMFAALPSTGEIRRVKEQIIAHMEDEYDALLAQGSGGDEALRAVIAQFGSIEEIEQEFAAHRAAPAPPPEPGADGRLQALEDVHRAQLPRAYRAAAAGGGCVLLAPVALVFWQSILLFCMLAALGAGLIIGFSWDYWEARRLLHHRRGELGLPPAGGAPGRVKRRLLLYGAYLAAALLAYWLLGALGGLWAKGLLVLLEVPAAVCVTELCWKEE